MPEKLCQPVLQAILFDLDGTLADTAPDLGAATNQALLAAGHPILPLEYLRPYTSRGVRGLLKAAFAIDPEHPDYQQHADVLLAAYAQCLCLETRLFPGIPELLSQIEARSLAWGIVTNKRMRFTDPLVKALALDKRAGCVVSGDTTAAAKPSPLPILHACQLLGCAPEKTLYIGDDRRDIEAGRAAGCGTIAVAYGYLGDSGPLEDWGADWIVDSPEQLSALLTTFASDKIAFPTSRP